MTPTERLISVILANRYTQVNVAEWATEANGGRPTAATVSRWANGITEPAPAVVKAIHDRFQAAGHDAVEGLV